MPVYRFIRSRNVIGFFSVSTIILIVPLIFYEDIYCSSYIDPFLAILAATGFSVGDFMSCRWSDFITGQQVASFFVIDSFL